ncbi:hypothetical protein CcI49_25685 [Frankia sp. CcI49]|uniref:LysR family transcriptional regulator n=1 Tax=Frankia sp. R43 TaxID=269536 RepID=UPI0006C9F0F2|nr:LysR family transcriptional regulator [Frankia sp. R43]KPM52744.1 hypothetical protein ACG83_25070 [Frankia sp. R43]ONH57833.1 hypothetical protein CcI49_25685 [Frankia sp. CcI49]
MKISQCSALVAASDSGSFTMAARRLGISQSAVSHAIAAMEADLGCALLERGRGGARLTDAGRAVIDHARAVVTQAEQIRRAARLARDGTDGTIRFATSQSFTSGFLPRVIDVLRVEAPRLRVELSEGTDQQIARWLRQRTVDVGVVTMPKTDLSTVPLWRDEFQLLVPTSHQLAALDAVDTRAVAEHPLLLPVGAVEPSVRAALRLVGLEPTVSYRMNDLNGLLAMVAAGLGIAILPARAVSSLPAGVSGVSLTPAVYREVALGVPTGGRQSRSTLTFVDVAHRVVRQLERPPSSPSRPRQPGGSERPAPPGRCSQRPSSPDARCQAL